MTAIVRYIITHTYRRNVVMTVLLLSVLVAEHAVGGGEPECFVAEPDDYRRDDYLAPVTCSLSGAVVISTQEAHALHSQGVLFIDVLPAPRRPAGLAPDAIWLPKRRRNIPASVWLPNVGFGTLPVEEAVYFRTSLAQVSAGDRNKALVFYCLTDCWMSWNAARRALEWGYTHVYWYPDGSDGWSMAGLPLEDSVPLPDGEGIEQ